MDFHLNRAGPGPALWAQIRPKKLKTAAEPLAMVAPPKKTIASRPPKRKSAASSSKKPASSKSAAPPSPIVESRDEDEEPLVKPKRSRMEFEVTPKVVPPSQAGALAELVGVQAPPRTSLKITPEGVSFGKAAQQALKATEEIFHDGHPAVAPNPPLALVEDPLLNIEDFLVEGQAEPVPPRQTSPARPLTQTPPGSRRSAPIVLDDYKQLNIL